MVFWYNRKVLLKISKNEVTNLRVVAGDFGGRPLKTLELLKMDAARALTQLTGQFDLVLLDPPYAKEQIVANITQLEEQGLLAEEVMLVCETDKAVDLPEEISNFGIWKQKTYGISKVTVYVR